MGPRLTKGLSALGATICVTQSDHRKIALEYLIHGVELVHNEMLDQELSDNFFNQFDDIMPNWAIETLTQGAYVREFHLWEKEAKEYFVKQLQLNGFSYADAKTEVQNRRKESIVDVVRRQLIAFKVSGLGEELGAINSMRIQVNKAKHDPGVLIEHFVSIEEFWDKHGTINRFWSKLANEEIWLGRPQGLP